MCTSMSEPQYGQDTVLVSGRGGQEDDTATGFRRSSIRDGPETTWSCLLQGHCLAHLLLQKANFWQCWHFFMALEVEPQPAT